MVKTLSKVTIFILLMTLCLSLVIYADSPQNYQSFGDPHAVRGGQLNLCISEFPKSFNAFTNLQVYAMTVFGLVYDSLLEINPTTLDYQPLIAKSWEISNDKKIFTFQIDPKAKWTDGKPITANDIKFTYDTIMNPKNLTPVMRMSLARFNPPEIINKFTIRFTAKTVHFNNLLTLAGLNILPEHLYKGKDFNKAFNMSLPPGSGPYTLSEVKEGRYYVLTRNKNYWADQFPQHRGMYNFDKIKYKVMDENVSLEAFKKGDFDIYNEIVAKRWATETKSEPFQKNWLVKQKVHNHAPSGFQGLVLNMRRPVFKSVKVRQAICYLLDRKTLIEKIMYNEYKPQTSYWSSLYGKNEATNPMIDYDPAKAKNLLREAGYTRLDKDGYLIDSNGNRLEFTISYYGESFEKHLTLYADDCKQVGVKINLELLSWATLLKKQDNFDFDAAIQSWGGVLFDDAEQLWYSKHADEIGSSNLPGYKNPEVDKLIESLPPIFDPVKRTQIIKEIDHKIYQDYPYVLMWGKDYVRVFYKNVFGKPKTVFTKYGDDAAADAIAYWWYDPVKVKRYEEAVKAKKSLPAEPVELDYDKMASR